MYHTLGVAGVEGQACLVKGEGELRLPSARKGLTPCALAAMGCGLSSWASWSMRVSSGPHSKEGEEEEEEDEEEEDEDEEEEVVVGEEIMDA